RQTVFRSNVRNVASESFFYDLPRKFASDAQVVDKAMRLLDDYAGSAFEHLVNDLEQRRCFNNEDKPLRKAIATFVAIQAVRTRLFRNQFTMQYGAILNEIERRRVEVPAKWKNDISDERVAFE